MVTHTEDFDDLTDPTRPTRLVAGPGHRVSGARHGRRSRRIGRARLLSGIGIAAAVVVASATSLTAYAAYDIGSGFERGAVDVGTEADSIDGAFNVLAVGADNDPAQGTAYGERGATLNDSNVLLHVSADHKRATAVSLPRDLLVDQPECGKSAAVTDTPLNQAYGRGGLNCVVKTVEQVSGMKIPFAAQVSFKGVISMSDAVGGVPVCVTSAIDDPYTGLDLKAGEHTVSGATALAFLRDRHGVGDGSDLSRISSLQQFLSSLLRKVKGDGTLGDPAKLYSLAKTASKNVILSTSLAKADTMVGMAQTFQHMGLGEITFVQYPGNVDDPSAPGKVVPDHATADRMMRAIASDRPITLGADSTGRGSTADDGADATSSTTGSAAKGDTTDTAAKASDVDEASRASRQAKPEDLPGVTGQTADQRTCAVASGG